MRHPSESTTRTNHTFYKSFADIKKLDTILAWVQTYHPGPCEARPLVMEMGCGTGNISLALAGIGCRVLGVDLDADSVQWAREHCPFPSAQFEVVDIINETISPGHFDVVVCSEVIEHLTDPVVALKKAHSLLGPGGILIVTTPNGWGPYELSNALRDRLRQPLARIGCLEALRRARGRNRVPSPFTGLSTLNRHTPHVQFFSPASLRRMMEEAGFRILKWHNSNFISFGWLRRVPLLETVDCTLADHLPSHLSSGWYLLCRKVTSEGE